MTRAMGMTHESISGLLIPTLCTVLIAFVTVTLLGLVRYSSLKLLSNNKKEECGLCGSYPSSCPATASKDELDYTGAKAKVEFGAKLAMSLVNGYALIEKVSWDNFNEGTTLITSVETYKSRFGYYPKEILADQIYRNRENMAFCKANGIRLSGPKLGRPSKDDNLAEQKRLTHQDSCNRNAIEGKFGEGKRRYGLGRIRARLVQTSESMITLQLLVMNLERKLRLFVVFFLNLFKFQIQSVRLTN
jgi:hypothetical protein